MRWKTRNDVVLTIMIVVGLGVFQMHLHFLSIVQESALRKPRHPHTKKCLSNKHKETFAGLLRYWNSLSERHRIFYIIGLGSLLGQYRNHDIIPWDDDVDVLVDVNDFKTLKLLAEERSFRQGWDDEFHMVIQPDFELREERHRRRWSCTGKQVNFQVDRCSFVSPMARVIRGYRALDIFPYVINNGSGIVHDVEMKKNYNTTHFFPSQRCTFMNVSTWCPRSPRKILETAYGDLRPQYVCSNGKWIFQGNYSLPFETNRIMMIPDNSLNFFHAQRTLATDAIFIELLGNVAA